MELLADSFFSNTDHLAFHLSLLFGYSTDSEDGYRYLSSVFGLNVVDLDRIFTELQLGNEKGDWPKIYFHLNEQYYFFAKYLGEPNHEVHYGLSLLGYDVVIGIDGGDSRLPALRPYELDRIMLSCGPSAVLLALPVCRWDLSQQTHGRKIIEDSLNSVVKVDKVLLRELSEWIFRNLIVDGVKWHESEIYGWVNNGLHSLRNPAAKVLNERDFSMIDSAFRDRREK